MQVEIEGIVLNIPDNMSLKENMDGSYSVEENVAKISAVYGKDIQNWETKQELSQNANTIDGGDFEYLTLRALAIAGGSGEEGFIVLKTKQWAIDYPDIESFCAQLKNLCKSVSSD